MTDSLLDECREAILKMAGTQAPEARRTLEAFAARFRAGKDTSRTPIAAEPEKGDCLSSAEAKSVLAAKTSVAST
jgi:hypothetical protein